MTDDAGPVLVCFALREEARPFRQGLKDFPNVRIVVTGIGRANTERAVAAALMEVRPSFVLTCGFAGGLDPALELNTVLFETTEATLAARLQGEGLRPARFHCASRMAVTVAEKSSLRRETGADAVEMESTCVHELCRMHDVTCATVRVISDTASEDMPLDFNALTTYGMKIHFGKLAFAIVKSPGKIRGLLRLQRQTASAATVLAAALTRAVRVLQALSADSPGSE